MFNRMLIQYIYTFKETKIHQYRQRENLREMQSNGHQNC